jgi:NAD(P)-dependent dehydrogenase (short-subunit alcohol dehydrogenase family)
LAQEGASVAVVDVVGHTADACAREIQKVGGSAVALTCDISNTSEVKSLAQKIQTQFPRVDILVNNAGIFAAGKWSDLEESVFDRIVGVNFKGPVLVTQFLLPLMRPVGNGAIVNVSSTFAFDHVSSFGIYSAMKAAIVSFTVSLSKEEARYGIRVNAVAPGSIDTPMNRDLKENPKMYDRVIKLTPLRRLGKPEEVANVVAFLVSDAAAYVTGQVVKISGGYVNPY